jgi:hypothetical protein
LCRGQRVEIGRKRARQFRQDWTRVGETDESRAFDDGGRALPLDARTSRIEGHADDGEQENADNRNASSRNAGS